MRVLSCRDHAAHAVCILVFQQDLHRVIHQARRAERRRRAQLDHDLRLVALMLGQPFQRMLEDGQVGGVILCELAWPQERSLGAVLARDCRDLLVIRRDDDARHRAGLPRCGDAPGDQRIACEIADILARDALRAAARRDDGKYFSHVHSTFASSSTIYRLSIPRFPSITMPSNRRPRPRYCRSCTKTHPKPGTTTRRSSRRRAPCVRGWSWRNNS